MNAVERIFQYSDEGVFPQEAAHEIEDSSPPPSWPEHGEVEFKDVVLRFGIMLLFSFQSTLSLIDPIPATGQVCRLFLRGFPFKYTAARKLVLWAAQVLGRAH